jgi:hypothetical protein
MLGPCHEMLDIYNRGYSAPFLLPKHKSTRRRDPTKRSGSASLAAANDEPGQLATTPQPLPSPIAVNIYFDKKKNCINLNFLYSSH